ncbi:ead/Ea22-like family protein [Escherichia coli]|uniref:ead/Ea22-like family protein n=1 Tax=Escherichia coli TaxID=562 RepID=UPI00188C88E3|nr:ead/Ea22-like family protein [Escherichia coli]MBF2849814.1 ead/Ea22-like family protein [Escherichia coli]MBF2859490.1 ead/Ea22-like family protein [Escherichia coli]
MSKIDYQELREAAEAIKVVATPQKLLAFRMKVTPQVVLALLDEREAKDKVWSAQDNHINQQADRIESLEKKNGELGRALEAAEKRIAELEAREISLPERSSMLHRTDFHDDYQTVMEYKVSEVIAAIRAAGIRIKGE